MRHVVGADDTAIAVGSGDVPVLGTPRLLALAEAATVALMAGELGPDQTSVGTRATIEHSAASPIGVTLDVEAAVVHRDGRLVRFDVAICEVAADGSVGRLVGRVEVTRVIVDRERFLAQVSSRA